MRGWTVIVTWMDGVQETYRAESYRVAEGELVLSEDRSYAGRADTRHIPLHNVRVWKAERP